MKIKDQIIAGDCMDVMDKIPEETFDFCFADPPYFMQIKEGKKLYRVEGREFQGCNDEWDKFESMEFYKLWTKKWLGKVHRILKKDGAICVISGMQSIYEIGNILREQGYWVINDIIWQKSNPTPNFGGTRLNNSHETIIWACKTKKSKFTFNYKTGKFLNDGKQMGSIWKLPVCSGNERLKDENGNKVHNTQKPKSLLYRIITLFTNKNDLILDPFAGTMTTGVVAKETGRSYTMIEKDERYIKYGEKRLNDAQAKIGDVENAIFDEKPEKVSFIKMTEAGFFKIGETFYDKNGNEAILMTNKGYLKYNGQIDSMHEIAGKMLKKERRVNAFDYLYVKRNEKLISISEIRNKYRVSIRY